MDNRNAFVESVYCKLDYPGSDSHRLKPYETNSCDRNMTRMIRSELVSAVVIKHGFVVCSLVAMYAQLRGKGLA